MLSQEMHTPLTSLKAVSANMCLVDQNNLTGSTVATKQ